MVLKSALRRGYERMRVIFWDFDGTLVQSSPLWRSSMIRALDQVVPKHNITLETLKPYVSVGFPWHSNEPHELKVSEQWWNHMERKFTMDFIAMGIPENAAAKAASKVKSGILNPESYRVFPEVPEVLGRLKKKDWRHIIVSNNHPELKDVVASLGLLEFFDNVITSAMVGFEKPHPQIFHYAIEAAGAHHAERWMVGDNPIADVEGAMRVGISAVLVRSNGSCKHLAKDLLEVESIFDQHSGAGVRRG
jgi:putative hydrolase of the HAD superfamily